MGWIITNCVIVKKHQNTVMNDLVPVWLSQRYMFKARDENYVQVVSGKINIRVSSFDTITAKANASVYKTLRVIGKVNILVPKRVVSQVKIDILPLDTVSAKTSHIIDYGYIDGFDKFFGVGDTK
jgi:hypothetical protein